MSNNRLLKLDWHSQKVINQLIVFRIKVCFYLVREVVLQLWGNQGYFHLLIKEKMMDKKILQKISKTSLMLVQITKIQQAIKHFHQ